MYCMYYIQATNLKYSNPFETDTVSNPTQGYLAHKKPPPP